MAICAFVELAFQIIYWYPDLMEPHNQEGQTALHLLAQNPSAFKSWSDMGFVEDFIYRCLIVDFPKFEEPSDFKEERCSKVTTPIRGNCRICLDSLITASKKVINAIVNTAQEWKGIAGRDKRQAMEDPNPDNKVEEQNIDCDHDHINGNLFLRADFKPIVHVSTIFYHIFRSSMYPSLFL
eukprot:TRINITY_DN22518_c0_g1_i5.p1 TRINITY_DN22518_c0_g1~~TRINITY_DN22518_c0_g1_i5.p1  ORF type:complete len:181 (-),score=29.24 TRINITY_DN22518_c0_g1_i5:2-544(-)